MAKPSSDTLVIADGSFDWSGGVDSSKVVTLQSDLNPNGLKRNQLAWLMNATVRKSGILQRTGWQPVTKGPTYGRYQGGFLYEPDGANPYLVCSVDGQIYSLTLEAPYVLRNLSAIFGLSNPSDAEMAFFAQGENYLVIQAGDYYTNPTPTLPLFWDGTTLRRSIGITNPAPAIAPNVNELPAATCMDYYGGRLWYAQGRTYGAGDMVGGPSGNAVNHRRDSILSVTENPLCFGGDNFTVPTNAGNIRALKHSANLNASLGQGQFYIFTRKNVYTLKVPVNRADWIAMDGTAAAGSTSPEQTVVQLVNGAVGHRCVVPVNEDLFFQTFEPSVRSLLSAVRNFGGGQWGNTPISQNEDRALQFNDRSLMRFSSGIEFNNRLMQAILPTVTPDQKNVVHRGIIPLDFDIVSNLQTEAMSPAWEGIWDGLNMLELFAGDFGGVPRAFAMAISELDGSLEMWEFTTDQRMQNGDNRVTWGVEFPAFTWNASGYENKLKQLNSGELWLDKIAGTVDYEVYFRPDADPCWRFWFKNSVCAARCQDNDPNWVFNYPCEPDTREGSAFTITFPEPKAVCNAMMIRPNTVGYQFQVRIMFKGWCRIRGLLLYALPKAKAQFEGIGCLTESSPVMATLPNPFA